MRAFLRLMQVLREADRLGPAFIQLPPYFEGRSLPVLKQFLERLPKEFPYAVEVRHKDWFDGAVYENSLNSLLTDRGIDRCHMDTRALFSLPPSDQYEEEEQRIKPRVPFRTTVTAQHPMIRIVGRNNAHESAPWLAEWAQVVATWIERGLHPILFIHAPFELYIPLLTRQMYSLLRETVPSLPDLAPWPGEEEARGPQQRLLF
jgi:uncharacterized protein YecE (DUF72 family)